MFKFLTLITYREDGVDTCRGCVMDRSSSDFSLNVFTDIESLVQHWAKHRWNLPQGREYCSTEYTLIIDGADAYTPHELEFEHEELRSQISKRLDEVLDDMNRAHKAHQAELAFDHVMILWRKLPLLARKSFSVFDEFLVH